MKTIDRYILREFLLPFAYCVLAFVMILIVYDLFDKLSTFIKWQVSMKDLARYYFCILPGGMVFMLPMAMLLALLYSLATFARHNELIAMRASGLSLRRLMLPLVALGVAGSLAMTMVSEWIVPGARDRAERFLLEQKLAYVARKTVQAPSGVAEPDKKGRARWAKSLPVRGLFFYNARDHRHWVVQELDPVKKVITNGVEVLQMDAAGQKEKWKCVASWGKYMDGKWWFFDVRIISLETLAVVESSRQRVMIELTETPKQLAAEVKQPDQMTRREIANYVKLRPSLSQQRRAELELNLHKRVAQPWMCLVMMLLGVTVGTRVGRRGPLVSVAGSLALFFVYGVFCQVSYHLGEAGYLGPGLAAWLPNLAFGSLGAAGYAGTR